MVLREIDCFNTQATSTDPPHLFYLSFRWLYTHQHFSIRVLYAEHTSVCVSQHPSHLFAHIINSSAMPSKAIEVVQQKPDTLGCALFPSTSGVVRHRVGFHLVLFGRVRWFLICSSTTGIEGRSVGAVEAVKTRAEPQQHYAVRTLIWLAAVWFKNFFDRGSRPTKHQKALAKLFWRLFEVI